MVYIRFSFLIILFNRFNGNNLQKIIIMTFNELMKLKELNTLRCMGVPSNVRIHEHIEIAAGRFRSSPPPLIPCDTLLFDVGSPSTRIQELNNRGVMASRLLCPWGTLPDPAPSALREEGYVEQECISIFRGYSLACASLSSTNHTRPSSQDHASSS